jgi:hemolysin III
MWKSRRYHHAVWHGCVLAGSICHFFAVFSAVVPPAA